MKKEEREVAEGGAVRNPVYLWYKCQRVNGKETKVKEIIEETS